MTHHTHCNHPAITRAHPLRLRHAAVTWTVVLSAMLPGLCLAQGSGSDLTHFARQWIDQMMSTQPEASQAGPLRPEVVIGNLDPRLQLAPCARIEPYLPKGTQLWGRTRIGIKCLEGPVAWNVFLPVTVKAWGPAWVIKNTVQAGALLKLPDAELVAEVDWADVRSPVLATPEQWVGMQAAYPLGPGQAIRQNVVRPPQVFAVGTEVRVITEGSGFQISATGQAMTSGQVGQQARVKLSNGKIVSGSVKPEGSVQISL